MALIFGKFLVVPISQETKHWSAANGGVTNGGLRGVWPPVLEIGRNRPFVPFFCLFRPFPEGPNSTWKIQKTEEKGLFLKYPRICLNPHLLNPHLRHPKSTKSPQRSRGEFGRTPTEAHNVKRKRMEMPFLGGPKDGLLGGPLSEPFEQPFRYI